MAALNPQPQDNDVEIYTFYESNALSARNILHSPQDCFHFISETWPGMIEDAMYTYSTFLEGLLLMKPLNS